MEPDFIRQSLHLQGFDPAHLAEVIRGGRFEHFILARSKCEVRHQRWACGNFSVDAASYSFAARACGTFTPDRICIGYIRGFTEPTWINGFECGMAAIQLYPPGSEINFRSGPGCEWAAIELDESAIQQAARERLGRELDLPRGHATNLLVPRAQRAALDHMVQRSIRQPETSRAMIAPITGAVAELLAHTETGTLETLARRWRRRESLLAHAEHFLRQNLGRPFDSKALAAAVGTTERCLQMHFVEAYGMSPGHWARCLALHRVRDRLLKAGADRFTVEGIAHDFGFRHMGRFAGYYAELFGEFPSATLVKAG